MRRIKRRGKSKTKTAADNFTRFVKRRRKSEKVPVEFISSGCTTLNLALSGKGRNGGWARGRIHNIVGDGSSGKTLLALEEAFWCWKNIRTMKSTIYPKVKSVTIVYNNCEGVMDFPIEKMYGKKFVKDVEWICSKNIEHMGRDYARRLLRLKKGEFLLYIIDSWDALGSEAGDKRFDESVEKDKPMESSYALEKQKFASSFFSNICGRMETNTKDATLCIVSQVRTKIGITFGKKTYRAGGKALDFYTHQVAWIRENQKLSKTKKKAKRVYGIQSHVKVERSKVAKPFRESNFIILYDYGLDDISSMVDTLWGKRTIHYNDKKFKTAQSFVKYIEDNNLEEELQKKTEKAWQRIEDRFEADVRSRKKRF
jgi:recombination protein RecA